MNAKKTIAIAILSAAWLIAIPVAQAQEVVVQTISSKADTGPSKANGARVSETSEPTVFTAPKDYVISEKKTNDNISILAARGSDHTYTVAYSDYIEVLPGILQPKTVTVTTHSRSERGAFGGGGSMSIVVDVYMTKYKNPDSAG